LSPVDRLPVFAAALWWGSLSAIGFLAVPLLFAHLQPTALAGQTAAKLFSAQAWVSLGCGLALLGLSRTASAREQGMEWAHGSLAWVLGGVLMALLIEFAVAPRIVARQNLALWHSVGTALYALQWLCAATVLWKVTAPVPRRPSP